MQKGSDLLDEPGLVFIVGLENGNICMHFWFKEAHAMAAVAFRLFSCWREQSYEIVGFGDSGSTGDWEHFPFSKQLPTFGLWIHKSANIPWSSNPCSIFRISHLSFAYFSALAKINTMVFSEAGQLIEWNLVLHVGAGRMPSGEIYESHVDSRTTADASSCIHILHVQKPTKMPQSASTIFTVQWEWSSKQEVVGITRRGDCLEIWKGQGSAWH